MIFSDNLKILGTAFHRYGFELRVVGGAVRDSILRMQPKDIDLCTNATPQEMIAIVEDMGFAYIPTGLQHGTITIVVNGDQFEVTTLRIDTETDGRHAVVEYTRDFEADAARRDLTINAMSMDFEGNIYDYFGGQEDLRNCRMRFVGDADARVKEDYLRILRYFRFAARFGGLDIDQVKAITTRENLGGLQKISVERYWLEMQKLVMMPNASEALDCMYYTGVLSAIGLVKPCMQFTDGMTPITALSTMVANTDEFVTRWKLSSDESKLLRFLNDKTLSVYFEEDVEDLLMDGVPRDWVVAKAQRDWVMASGNMVTYAKTWDVPTFPVTGQDLLDKGFATGKALGEELTKMRKRWKQSVFEQNPLTKDDLLF